MNKKTVLSWVIILAVIAGLLVWYFFFGPGVTEPQQELTQGDTEAEIQQDLEMLEQDLGNLDSELSDIESELSDLETDIQAQ